MPSASTRRTARSRERCSAKPDLSCRVAGADVDACGTRVADANSRARRMLFPSRAFEAWCRDAAPSLAGLIRRRRGLPSSMTGVAAFPRHIDEALGSLAFGGTFFLACGREPTGGSGPSETIADQVFSPPCSPLRCLRAAPRAQGFALFKKPDRSGRPLRCRPAGSGARPPPETVRRRKEELSSAALSRRRQCPPSVM